MTNLRSLKIDRHFSATRTAASLIGVFGGLLGLEHGYFETLQGPVAPGGLMFSAIGPPCRMEQAWHGCEPAMTIIPNLYVTGVVAIAVSLCVIIWAAAFVQKKNGARILVLLSILQLLVGGGFVPVFIGLIAGIAGERINTPLNWWRAHLSMTSRRLLARLWPWSLIVFLVWDMSEWILGDFFNDYLLRLGLVTLLFTLGLPVLTVITGFAYDVEKSVSRDSA